MPSISRERFTMKKWLAFSCVAILAAGCASTKQARSVGHSGFLGDYSQLKPASKPSDSLLTYANPLAKWASYDKVILDPVMVWKSSETPGESQ